MKWYAWYMLGYCYNKKDYRLFKVARMRNLKRLEELFSIKHENIDKFKVEKKFI
jgi:predicted DNA-binding transcriptional regulator YafY